MFSSTAEATTSFNQSGLIFQIVNVEIPDYSKMVRISSYEVLNSKHDIYIPSF